MKIAICDDEAVFCEQLKHYLKHYYKSLDVSIETFSSGEIFLETYKLDSLAYELIFMDIEMKQLDGIEVARVIREYNRDVILIFLTSHVEYAMDGYEVDAFRFLGKPVSEKKLVEALHDVQRERERNRRLLIKEADKEFMLRHKDIVSIEAQNVMIHIKTMDHSYVIRKKLLHMEEEVEGTVFYKPHRSYLINLGFVTNYNNKGITMENGDVIPLSRNKLAELKRALMLYVKTCGR